MSVFEKRYECWLRSSLKPTSSLCSSTRQMRRQIPSRVRFAVCIRSKGYEASLERGKVYRMIPDAQAARHGYVRIVDESGEDYGYTAERFIPIDLPKPLEKALFTAAC